MNQPPLRQPPVPGNLPQRHPLDSPDQKLKQATLKQLKELQIFLLRDPNFFLGLEMDRAKDLISLLGDMGFDIRIYLDENNQIDPDLLNVTLWQVINDVFQGFKPPFSVSIKNKLSKFLRKPTNETTYAQVKDRVNGLIDAGNSTEEDQSEKNKKHEYIDTAQQNSNYLGTYLTQGARIETLNTLNPSTISHEDLANARVIQHDNTPNKAPDLYLNSTIGGPAPKLIELRDQNISTLLYLPSLACPVDQGLYDVVQESISLSNRMTSQDRTMFTAANVFKYILSESDLPDDIKTFLRNNPESLTTRLAGGFIAQGNTAPVLSLLFNPDNFNKATERQKTVAADFLNDSVSETLGINAIKRDNFRLENPINAYAFDRQKVLVELLNTTANAIKLADSASANLTTINTEITAKDYNTNNDKQERVKKRLEKVLQSIGVNNDRITGLKNAEIDQFVTQPTLSNFEAIFVLLAEEKLITDEVKTFIIAEFAKQGSSKESLKLNFNSPWLRRALIAGSLTLTVYGIVTKLNEPGKYSQATVTITQVDGAPLTDAQVEELRGEIDTTKAKIVMTEGNTKATLTQTGPSSSLLTQAELTKSLSKTTSQYNGVVGDKIDISPDGGGKGNLPLGLGSVGLIGSLAQFLRNKRNS